ncbi:PepSY domain-containing protein [Xanthobacter sp. TB0136]|uniref:PepSY domain-containing protein n=1 Tax=Xanthobacter sp. TB0136 TaxID=3459177 RepID=UPI00403A39F1
MFPRLSPTFLRPLALPLVLALSAATLPGAAMAEQPGQTAPRGSWKSLSAIATHLAENGYRVLELDRERHSYEAEMIDRNGNLVKADIDPVTGELQNLRNRGASSVADDPQWKTLPQIAVQLEAQGYEVRKLEMKLDRYEADLTSRDGQRIEARIDPRNGQITSSERD